MGLYGAATSNAVEANVALDTPAEAYPGAAYDAELLLVYSEIDPALHAAVADGTYGTDAPGAPQSTLDYRPRYFLVNGQAADEASPAVEVAAGSQLLVRLVNAGLFDHAPQLLGSYLSVIAEDGNPYPYPRQHTGLLLAAGKTRDALFAAPTVAGRYSLYDRRFYRSDVPAAQGSMVRYISVQ
jgi:FtsP/CotA-like multicopper oxidase with cupredoxin domain